MSCPDCNQESRQKWHNGYSATRETPAEPAGYSCGWCGNEYGSEAERMAEAVDRRYDEQVQDVLDAEYGHD